MTVDLQTIEKAVAIFEQYSEHDDETMYYLLEDVGIDSALCTKLIQMIPMVFTRFLFRPAGVHFAPEYHQMDRTGNISDPIPFTDNPVYRAVSEYCDSQPADSWAADTRIAIAARSGGYQAIVQAQASGQSPDQIMTSRPILMG